MSVVADASENLAAFIATLTAFEGHKNTQSEALCSMPSEEAPVAASSSSAELAEPSTSAADVKVGEERRVSPARATGSGPPRGAALAAALGGRGGIVCIDSERPATCCSFDCRALQANCVVAFDALWFCYCE